VSLKISFRAAAGYPVGLCSLVIAFPFSHCVARINASSFAERFLVGRRVAREWAQGDHRREQRKTQGKPQHIWANKGVCRWICFLYFPQELRVALLANFKSKLTAKHLHFGLYAKAALKAKRSRRQRRR